ncbi:MAG: rhodanese-like domain-containing protein [Calditrichia bacterium]|nr:rhodanese-like domain-containing protein [Calditrichia bacterium]
MEILPLFTRQSFLRISAIIFASLVLGLIYNQLHPHGLHWRFLFSPALSDGNSQKNPFTVISADSAFVLMNRGDVIFIDTREAEDFQLDHISGAINVPIDIFLTASDNINLPGDETLILLYDQEGNIEKLALSASVLKIAQKKRLYILYGGYLSWLNRGFPLEQGLNHD